MTHGPSFDNLTSRFISFLETTVPRSSRILVAVSGGSDSIGLLHLFAGARERLSLVLKVGFVDHGLREGIEKERRLVKREAEGLGVSVVCAAVPEAAARIARHRGSIQSWAREERYRLLVEMAHEHGMTHLATGHTLDDQAETVLLRMLRGCGLDGLAGIHPCRETAGVRLIRPLLGMRREEIQRGLGELGAAWADDPSNLNPRFLRTRVRTELLPLMNALQPDTTRRIAAMAEEARACVIALDSNAIPKDAAIERLNLCSGVRVKRDVFKGLDKNLWGRLVRRVVKTVKGDLRGLERSHIEPILELLGSGRTTGLLPLPGDTALYLDRGALYAFPRPLPPASSEVASPVRDKTKARWRLCSKSLAAEARIEAKGAEEVEGLELRARRPGDRLHNSDRRLKEVLAKAKVPRIYRDYIPVLALGDRVVACPEVVPCRLEEISVTWRFDDTAPIRDIYTIFCGGRLKQ